MRSSSILRLTVFTLALATLAPRPVKADDVYGRIRGTVTDPSGAVIGGAKVTATNVDTGISRSVRPGPTEATNSCNWLRRQLTK